MEKASVFLDIQLLLKAPVMDIDGWKESNNLLQTFYIEYYVNYKSYKRKIKLEKKAFSSVNKISAAETGVGSSVGSEEEFPEKVSIDSDSDDEDDELINNNPITSVQQMKAADEEAEKTEFKIASKKWCLYGNSLPDDQWRMLYPSFRTNVNLIWWRI